MGRDGENAIRESKLFERRASKTPREAHAERKSQPTVSPCGGGRRLSPDPKRADIMMTPMTQAQNRVATPPKRAMPTASRVEVDRGGVWLIEFSQ